MAICPHCTQKYEGSGLRAENRHLKKCPKNPFVSTSYEGNLNKFIFDKDKVLKEAIFPFCKLPNGVYAFGLCLPKEKEEYDKNGNLVKNTQIRAPVLIGSDKKLYEISDDFERDNKLTFPFLPLPNEYELRWELSSLESFLKNKSEPIDGKEIFKNIKQIYCGYLYFDDDTWYKIHALWDMATYSFLLFYYFPLFELRGIKGSAKNKIMAISRAITFNASEEMTDPSESTLFRDTTVKRHTKYIDEAENLFSFFKGKVEADKRAQLINSGYKYTGHVPRMDKIGNKFFSVSYPTYSPSMIASINGLYGATEDRALIHITTKAPKDDNRANLEPNPNEPIFQDIRNKLYIFTLQNASLIEKEYAELKTTELTERDFWLWKPLLTMAKIIDKELYLEVLEFAKEQTKIKKIDGITEDSFEGRLIIVAYELLKKDGTRILFKDISEELKKQFPDQKAPASKTISNHLNKLGFRKFNEHFDAGNGYLITIEKFESLVRTFAPNIIHSDSSDSSVYRGKDKQKTLNNPEENEEKKAEEKKEGNYLLKTEQNEANEEKHDNNNAGGVSQ